MREETSTQDLKERLALIETMIAEGRRRTQSWGWVFLLWGVAYYVAIAWAAWGRELSVWGNGNYAAWPVTMAAAAVLTLIIGIRKGKDQPVTTVGRAIVAVWSCVGVSMFLLFPALAINGRLDEHAFVALVAAMLGVANGASGFILRWKSQVLCAIVWWVTSVAACFRSVAQLTVVFLAAIFVCQIVFGIYAMILEARRRAAHGVVHA
jgi:hypothetical protein